MSSDVRRCTLPSSGSSPSNCLDDQRMIARKGSGGGGGGEGKRGGKRDESVNKDSLLGQQSVLARRNPVTRSALYYTRREHHRVPNDHGITTCDITICESAGSLASIAAEYRYCLPRRCPRNARMRLSISPPLPFREKIISRREIIHEHPRAGQDNYRDNACR